MEANRQVGPVSPDLRPPKAPPPYRFSASSLFLLAACSAFLYLRILGSYFLIDDVSLIYLCGKVASADPRMLLTPDIGIYWRPVAKLSFALDHMLWGFNPLGYHLTSVVLHALCTLAVTLLTRRLSLSRDAALMAGLLFALHPIHAYAVSWIAARYDLLCTLFCILCLLAFLRHLERGGLLALLGVVGFQTLAVLSKELAFVLPLALAFIGLAAARGAMRERIRRAAWPVLLSAAALAAVLAMRVKLMGGIGGPDEPTGDSLFAAPDIVGILRTLLLIGPGYLAAPANRGLPVTGRLDGPAAAALLAVAFLVSLWLWVRRGGLRQAWIGFGLMVIFLVPFSPFVYLSPSLQGSYMLYLSSAGFCLAIGALIFTPLDARLGTRLVRNLTAFAFVILYPLSLHANLGAFVQAGRTSKAIVEGVARMHPYPPQGTRFTFLNFPGEVHGAILFFDKIDLLFIHRYDLEGLEMIVANENLLRLNPDLEPAGEAASDPNAVFLRWNQRAQEPRDATESVRRALKQRDAAQNAGSRAPIVWNLMERAQPGWSAGNRVRWPAPADEALPDGTLRLETGEAENPGLADTLALADALEIDLVLVSATGPDMVEIVFEWSGTHALAGPVLERSRFFTRADGARRTLRIRLAADPRWALTRSVDRILIEAHIPRGILEVSEVRFLRSLPAR